MFEKIEPMTKPIMKTQKTGKTIELIRGGNYLTKISA